MEFSTQITDLLNALFTWDNLIQLAFLITTYLGSDIYIVNFVNWLKLRLNVADKWAELLLIGTTTIVSIAVLLVEGVLVPETLTLTNFGFLVGTITYAAHKRYLRLKQKETDQELNVVEAKVYDLQYPEPQ